MSTELPANSTARPTRREYGEFIGQIDLRAIWLKHAELTNYTGLVPPTEARFSIEDLASWTIEPGVGFRVSIQYIVELRAEASTAMRLVADYELLYSSEKLVNEGLFSIFRVHNLPVNAWPYLREYLANTLGRFGWPPFTLPAFKVNTPPRAEEPTSPVEQPPKKRSVRAKSRTLAASAITE